MARSSMQDRRVWLGGGAAIAALIAAAAWFLLISPELSATDDLHAQAAAQRLQNSDTARQVAELKTKSAHLSTYTASLRDAMDSLPADSGLAGYTRQVRALSIATGVAVDGISVGQIAPALSDTAATTANGATSDGSSSSGSTTSDGSSSSGSTSSTGTSTSGSTDSSTNSTTGTTTGTTGTTGTGTGATPGTIYALPITLTTEGSLPAQQRFLERVRSAGPRYGLVTSAQFAPSAGAKEASIDGHNTMTTQVTVFSEPLSDEQLQSLTKLLHGDIGS